MDILFYLFAGILQGALEWLPVSSSGQIMILFMAAFSQQPSEAFSVAIYLHAGTLLAVLVRMRSDVSYVIHNLSNFRTDRIIQFLFVSSILSALIGVPVYVLMRHGFTELDGRVILMMVGLLLVFSGIFLYSAKKVTGNRRSSDLSRGDMVLLGLVQGFSILPGVSRSGVTVASLLLQDIRQDDALRLSFLMSIPAVCGAIILELIEGVALPEPAIASGIFAAFVSGYVIIDILLKLAHRLRFDVFCIIFGILTTVFSLLNLML